MTKDEARENFEKWQAAWDKASVEFAKESAEQMAKAPQQPSVSFFTGMPNDNYKQPEFEGDPDWNAIWRANMGLLTDDTKYSDGETKPQAAFGAFTPTKTNPTTQSSTGSDQDLRVTKNWSDGPELRELDEIKRRLEELERKHHEDQVNGKAGLKAQLESLRDRVHKLSEKINRNPEVDVT